jgi:hypothetical protein
MKLCGALLFNKLQSQTSTFVQFLKIYRESQCCYGINLCTFFCTDSDFGQMNLGAAADVLIGFKL